MAENSSSEFATEDRRLSDIYDEALKNYEEIMKSTDAASSPDVQVKIRSTIKLFEDATKLINIGGVFSSNEFINEIPTEHLKYLLSPVCLGNLVTKLQSPDRLAVLDTAEVYFKDYLKRLQEYEVISGDNIPETNENDCVTAPKQLNLQEMALKRNEKIRKYNQQKQLEFELGNLKLILAEGDEDVTRKYYTTFMRSLVNVAVDELASIQQEKPLAKHFAEARKGKTLMTDEAEKKLGSRLVSKPLKPIIITRNELQKKVFGIGYPSLPTMTVDEFYQQRVAEGIFPADGSKYSKTLQDLADPDVASREDEKDEMKKETEVETDDLEALAKARNFDEYKDDHKRGWGNRMNRS